jgi:hypothetical protein
MAAALLPEVLQPEGDKAQQKLTPRADSSSASTEPDGPEQRARLRFNPIRFLGSLFRQALTHSRTFSSGAWKSLPAYLSFYLLLIVAGYAAWEAQTPVTIIAPFQLPKADLPFSGDIRVWVKLSITKETSSRPPLSTRRQSRSTRSPLRLTIALPSLSISKG